MRPRTWVFLAILGMNLLWALSTGARMYLLFFAVMAAMLVLSLASVWLARLTLRTECELPEPYVQRESEVELVVRLSHRGLLPIAPLLLTIDPPDGGPTIEARVAAPLFASARCTQRLYCPHVGIFPVGVRSIALSDVFLLFTLRVRPQDNERALVVRPQVGDTRPLRFSPGESSNAMMARATEDTSDPADVRSWQEGDPLKRIHWKLSMRKRELLVRTFEEPMRLDALVMVNCAPLPGGAETAHALRDVLCETAASLASAQLREGKPVRMPLIGGSTRDIDTDRVAELPAILDALAEESFQGTQDFERILMGELHRLHRTGTICVVTAALNSRIADMVIQMRRMGPYARVYYAHPGAIQEEEELLLSRLEHFDVEVETIALVNDYLEQAG